METAISSPLSSFESKSEINDFMVSSCILYKHYRIQINEANIYKLKVYRAKLINFISFQLYEVLILCDNRHEMTDIYCLQHQAV